MMPALKTNDLHAGPAARSSTRRIDPGLSLKINQELRLSFASDCRLIPAVINVLLEFCDRNGLLSEREQARAGVALDEALVNAVVHGNLEVNSHLRDLDDGSFEKLVAVRREKAPYRHRLVEAIVRYSVSDVSFIIRDEGMGFNVSSVPNPTVDEFTIRSHGRGLLLMRAFADKVVHNSVGNEVTLMKRRNLSPQE